MSNSTIIANTPTTSPTDQQTAGQQTTSNFGTTSDGQQTSLTPSTIVSTITSGSPTPSVQGGSTTTVEPSTGSVVTSVVSLSSRPGSTELVTSVVTQPDSTGGSTVGPTTVVITTNPSATAVTTVQPTDSTTSAAATTTSSTPASLQNEGSSNAQQGLTQGSKTAIAVVVPVVVVALLVIGALFLWRKRKQKKNAAEARRKEVEEYGYNPNNDPTLPAVGADGQSEMTEDHGSGYRGWGATTYSNRKASTTLSGGHTQGQPSDGGSNQGGYNGSPTTAAASDDQHSGENLVGNRDTMSSDDLAALGAAPVAGANRANNDMRRGKSNASSSYSAGNRSDHSDPNLSQGYGSDGYPAAAAYNYAAQGPYGDGSYGAGDGMPVVRDVSARRNTRIEPGGGYQQGNSGIAQNF